MIKKIKIFFAIGLCSIFVGIGFISNGADYLQVVRGFINLYGALVTFTVLVSILQYAAENS